MVQQRYIRFHHRRNRKMTKRRKKIYLFILKNQNQYLAKMYYLINYMVKGMGKSVV